MASKTRLLSGRDLAKGEAIRRKEKQVTGDVIAQADFRLTGTGWNGKAVNETVHAELAESGAFQYGNQTCMAFIWENGNIDSYDTRYERVSKKNFKEFAKAVLEDRVLKTIKVEVVG